MPALLPLMALGFLLGPSVVGVVDVEAFGEVLPGMINVAVVLLIFEGALHLDQHTFSHAPRVVRNLLTVGALLTWAGASALAYLLLGLSIGPALILGAILIVTGPTVIQPILRRVQLTPKLHSALMSEGILIDPIGVIAAVVTLEIVLVGQFAPGTQNLLAMVWQYVKPFFVGIVTGVVAGYLAVRVIRHASVDEDVSDEVAVISTLAATTASAGISEYFAHEAGLVSAAACGMVIARKLNLSRLGMVRRAMEAVSALLVGTLFILLASRFNVQTLELLENGSSLLGMIGFLVLMIVVVRPACAVISCWGSQLSVRERVYLALTAPRGIVAVSAAALAATQLERFARAQDEVNQALVDQARVLELATLLVVVITVATASVFSGPLATLLRVRGSPPNGVIIVGAHRLARDVARAVRSLGIPVRLADRNAGRIAIARNEGLDAHVGDATDARWMEDTLVGVDSGCLIAMTGNDDVDTVVTRYATERFGKDRALRWPTPMDVKEDPNLPKLLDPETHPYTRTPADLLRALSSAVEQGHVWVQTWPGDRTPAVRIAVVKDKRLSFPPSQDPTPEGATGLGVAPSIGRLKELESQDHQVRDDVPPPPADEGRLTDSERAELSDDADS